MEFKIAVVGDPTVGKTLLCHRLQTGHKWQTTASMPPLRGQEFYFAQFDDSVPRVAPNQSFTSDNSDGWYDVAGRSAVTLKIAEPSGVDRSSLQQIIFRKVCGLIVVYDALSVWEEFLATDTTPLSHPTGRGTGDYTASLSSSLRDGWRTYLHESLMFWVRMALHGSRFTELYPDAKFPVFAVFNKVDTLTRVTAPAVDAAGRTGSMPPGGTQRWTSCGAQRDSDSQFITLDVFFSLVAKLCCNDVYTNVSQLSTVGGVTSAVPLQQWPLDSDGTEENQSPLLCDGCFFVSSVDEAKCPNRTHQIANEMIEVLYSRIRKTAEDHGRALAPSDTGRRSRCCKSS